MEHWQKLLLAAGGAVGAAAVLYYLLSEEEDDGDSKSESQDLATKGDDGEMSKEEVIETLKEMVGSTAKASEISKQIADGGDMPMDKLFEMLSAKVPDDPMAKLASKGLTMEAVDRGIERHQNDPEVFQMLQKLMGGEAQADAPRHDISSDKIIEVIKCQSEATEKFIKEFTALADREKHDPKTVLTAVSAVASAKVLQKFGLEDKDIQFSIMQNQQELSQKREFIAAFQKHQVLIGGFASSIGLGPP